ncbi:MAG: hypothetical protein WDO69_28095 [Pseudomonadota bacterium]
MSVEQSAPARQCLTVSPTRNRWLLLSAVLLGSSLSRLAAGQSGEPCNGPEITLLVPAAQRDKWLTRRADLAEHLRTLRDLDRCAQLTLRAVGDTLVLDVRTGDGRLASRPVQNEAQLLRASEALLTLPPRLSSAPLAVSAAENPPEDAPARAPSASARVLLGAAAAARLGGKPLFIAGGVAGFAEVAVEPWLLGVSARWDIATGLLGEPSLMDYYLMSTAIGVHVGRRFELESVSLDLLLGPNLVLEFQDADDRNLEIGGSAADVRIDLGARLSGPRRSSVRAFGSADFEVSPARLAKEHFVDSTLPPLPSFSFGLSFGVLWSGK